MKVNKEQIIRKSIGYFASHDYEGVSLNDIAGALDITKGGIYHYFRSKDELFRDAVLFILDQLEGSLDQEAFGDAGLKDIMAMFIDFESFSAGYVDIFGLDVMRDYKNLVYLIFTAIKKYPEVEERMRDSYLNIIRSIEYFFRTAAEAGQIRGDLDFEAAAFLLSAYIEGGLLLNAVGAASGSGGDMPKRVLELFWSLLTGENNEGEYL